MRFADDQDPPVLYARCAANVSAINHLAFFFEEESRKIKSLYSYDLPSLTAFDDTQEWMVADAQEEAHVLGGTTEFIHQYYEAAGGEEYVRAWYYHSEIGHLKEIDHKVLYDMAGWPHPVYPDGKHLFGDDIDWAPMFGARIRSWGPGLTYDEWGAQKLKCRIRNRSGDIHRCHFGRFRPLCRRVSKVNCKGSNVGTSLFDHADCGLGFARCGDGAGGVCLI